MSEEEFKDLTKAPEVSPSKSNQKTKKKSHYTPSFEQKVTRVKLPHGKEVIGVIQKRLGGNKMMVDCVDGKERNSRVPGRLRRALWLRPRDVVIVLPWELDDKKADVLFKYRPNQITWLRKNGHLENEKSGF